MVKMLPRVPSILDDQFTLRVLRSVERNSRPKSVDAVLYRDPFSNPITLREDVARNVKNVPKDGSCLYHALTLCLQKSPWDKMYGTINSASDMRQAISKFFFFNSEMFEKDHGDVVKALSKNDNYDANSVKSYAEHIRSPNTWGGDLEIDVASVMLDVIIHRFDVVDGSKDFNTALLMASFFPTEHAKGLSGAQTRSFTKWSIVWRNNHFQYALPLQPRGSTAASEKATRQANESIKHLRATKNRTPGLHKQNSNSLLAYLARERHEREEKMRKEDWVKHILDRDEYISPDPSCPPGDPLVNLTQDQKDDAASMELIEQILTKDRQEEEDRLLAKALDEIDQRI
jgi:hypothetical protein